MEIERINENTIKFYISYLDIEEHGFERDEIWHNRERSEQLFWKMMEEVNYKEDFVVEGPLWIQVQALEKGLEVLVTKSQLTKNGENIKLPLGDDTALEMPIDARIEDILENKFGQVNKSQDDTSEEEIDEGDLSIIVKFKDFEDVIQLSHYYLQDLDGIEEVLYHFEDDYYLFMEFSQEVYDDHEQEDIISQILEFADDSNISFHLLEAYGKKIFEENALAQIKSYFTNQSKTPK